MGELYLDNIERLLCREESEEPEKAEPGIDGKGKRNIPVFVFEPAVECPGFPTCR